MLEARDKEAELYRLGQEKAEQGMIEAEAEAERWRFDHHLLYCDDLFVLLRCRKKLTIKQERWQAEVAGIEGAKFADIAIASQI